MNINRKVHILLGKSSPYKKHTGKYKWDTFTSPPPIPQPPTLYKRDMTVIFQRVLYHYPSSYLLLPCGGCVINPSSPCTICFNTTSDLLASSFSSLIPIIDCNLSISCYGRKTWAICASTVHGREFVFLRIVSSTPWCNPPMHIISKISQISYQNVKMTACTGVCKNCHE